MTNDKNSKYDLGERTSVFGENTIKFAKLIPINEVSRSLIGQFVRSGTSVGANYCEADCAETKKDFEHKMGICKKESKEVKYWLRMIATTAPELKDQCKVLWRESNELNLIFSSIVNKSKKKI